MKKVILIIAISLFILITQGCEMTIKNNSSNVSNTPKEISIEDFDIYYNDIAINDKIPFEQIAEKLGISIGEIDDIKASTSAGGYDIGWYLTHYPNKENEEIRIEYLINKTLNTGYLVHIDLYKAKTSRNIGIGDDLEKMLSAYGNSVEPRDNSTITIAYYYRLDNKPENIGQDKEIAIIVDKNTQKITEISINYNLEKAMEEADIVSFD